MTVFLKLQDTRAGPLCRLGRDAPANSALLILVADRLAKDVETPAQVAEAMVLLCELITSCWQTKRITVLGAKNACRNLQDCPHRMAREARQAYAVKSGALLRVPSNTDSEMSTTKDYCR